MGNVSNVKANGLLGLPDQCKVAPDEWIAEIIRPLIRKFQCVMLKVLICGWTGKTCGYKRFIFCVLFYTVLLPLFLISYYHTTSVSVDDICA